MTLDEAIKHAEEVMVENLEKTKDRNASDPIAINCFECAEEHQQLAEWLKELKQLREQTRWIPVSEKLPEERKAVLVYAPEYKNIYCAYLDGDAWFIFGGYGTYAVANVIAWMPLPQPYKGE